MILVNTYYNFWDIGLYCDKMDERELSRLFFEEHMMYIVRKPYASS